MGIGHEKVTIDIDDVFANLDTFYPGSKKARRESVTQDDSTAVWDAKPVMKFLNGVPTEFFYIGALASALAKSVVSIRLWERKSYIPKSPYRFPSFNKKNGEVVLGKRVLTRVLIEIAIEEFDTRGLIGTARIEWAQHTDLTVALVERWTAATTPTA